MFNLVSSILVIVLLILVLVLGFLVYLFAAYKAEVEELQHKKKTRKLYTYKSPFECIENVVYWKEHNQRLCLILDSGSICVVSAPDEYRLDIQDQSEEEEDSCYAKP